MRLMLTLTPIVCVCAALVVSEILTTYLDLRKPGLAENEDIANVIQEVSSSKQRPSSPTPQKSTGIVHLDDLLIQACFIFRQKQLLW